MSKNYDYVLGQNSYDCGISSIMTILNYYGIKSSREKIISKFKKHDNGYTAYDLIKIAKMYGINGYGIKTNINKLNKLPVIAHTIKDKNMFHFIVILEKSDRKKLLKVMDPSEGIKTITFEKFNKITTNIFLIFEGGKKKSIKDQRFKKEMFKIFHKNKKAIFMTLLFSILYIVLSLIFNYYLKIMLSNSSNFSLLLKIFIIFLQMALMKNFINYIKDSLKYKIFKKINKDLTEQVTSHIFNLPYEYFTKKTTGELVTIVEDVEVFKQVVTKVFVLSLVDFILLIVIISYLFFLNMAMAFICLVLIIILLFFTKRYQYIFNDNYVRLKRSKIDYTSFLINYLTSFETVKNLNISDSIIKMLSNKYSDTLNRDEEYNKNYYKYSLISSLSIDSFYLLIIFVSLFFNYNTNVFDVVLFSSIYYLVVSLLNNINESISLYKVYQTSTDRVLDCLEIIPEKFGKTNLSKVNTIKFVNVNYKVNNLDVLKEINLELKKGDKVFITGDSGIGKSTLVKLLLRFFTPTKGNILIDDLNIKDLDLSFIRNNITYIGQNESLFSGSILDNLKLVSSSMENIEDASAITLLDKFLIKNNVDYNYLIEESGNNLSGGERKKIILTRGILHFKDVLILDEVFNEISVEEEKEILSNIFGKYKDKIIIAISHRNTNSNLFDKKYKLEGDGRIHEIK